MDDDPTVDDATATIEAAPGVAPSPFEPDDGPRSRGASASVLRFSRGATEASASDAGRVQPESFEEALQVVDVMRDVTAEMEASKVSHVDEIVLGVVEEEAAAVDDDDESVRSHRLSDNGSAAETATSGGISASSSVESLPGMVRDVLDVPPARLDKLEKANRASAGRDDGAPPPGRVQPTPAQPAAQEQAPPPARRGTRRAGARAPTRRAPPGGGGGGGAAPGLASCAKRARVYARTLVGLLSAEAWRVLLLLPYALAFWGHADEPLRAHWRLWLLRPLYVLVGARVFVGVFFGLFNSSPCLELLPYRVTVLVDGFDGWPAVALVWVSLMSALYNAEHALEPEAWAALRGVPFLHSVNGWVCACALTRGLLEGASAGLFDSLQRGHFQARVRSAVLSLRVLRILFGQARAARARAYDRLRSAARRPKDFDPTLDEALFPAGAGGASTLDDHLDVLRDALKAGAGFVASLGEARQKGANAFNALRVEVTRERRASDPPAAFGAPPQARTSRAAAAAAAGGGAGLADTIPRARLVRWCVDATRMRGKGFRRQLEQQVLALFPAEHVSEAEFVAAVENAYKEQRYINAAVSSFDSLNSYVRAFGVGLWAAVMLIAGVFLVDWGVDPEPWVLPLSSTVLSAALVLGFLPYETISGVLYVLLVRPYDIGDRILVTQPGLGGEGVAPLVVQAIHLTHTSVIAWNGEQHTLMNHIVRRMGVINMNRSQNPVLPNVLQVPACTPAPKVSELLDSVREYIGSTPQDWVRMEVAFIAKNNYSEGHLEIWVMATSAHKRWQEDVLDAARTRLYLFVHGYMQAAGIEYVRPVQQVRAEVVAHEPAREPARGGSGGGAADGGGGGSATRSRSVSAASAAGARAPPSPAAAWTAAA